MSKTTKGRFINNNGVDLQPFMIQYFRIFSCILISTIASLMHDKNIEELDQVIVIYAPILIVFSASFSALNVFSRAFGLGNVNGKPEVEAFRMMNFSLGLLAFLMTACNLLSLVTLT